VPLLLARWHAGTLAGVFTREWTKATVQTDCSTYTSSITMK